MHTHFLMMKAFFIRRGNSKSFKRLSSSLVKHEFERLYQTEYLDLEQTKNMSYIVVVDVDDVSV